MAAQLQSEEFYGDTNYRCRVQAVRLGPERCFQVRIGMEGDRTLDYVPAYQSAFGNLLQLSVAHVNEADAELEALMLLEFIRNRVHGGPCPEYDESPFRHGEPPSAHDASCPRGDVVTSAR